MAASRASRWLRPVVPFPGEETQEPSLVVGDAMLVYCGRCEGFCELICCLGDVLVLVVVCLLVGCRGEFRDHLSYSYLQSPVHLHCIALFAVCCLFHSELGQISQC